MFCCQPASVLKPKTCFEQPKIRNKREKQEATEKQDKAYIKKKKVLNTLYV